VWGLESRRCTAICDLSTGGPKALKASSVSLSSSPLHIHHDHCILAHATTKRPNSVQLQPSAAHVKLMKSVSAMLSVSRNTTWNIYLRMHVHIWMWKISLRTRPHQCMKEMIVAHYVVVCVMLHYILLRTHPSCDPSTAHPCGIQVPMRVVKLFPDSKHGCIQRVECPLQRIRATPRLVRSAAAVVTGAVAESFRAFRRN
jgi:hypothetical protein